MDYLITDSRVEFFGVHNFDLKRSCNCGQAFRWVEVSEGLFACVIEGNCITAEIKNDILICNFSGEPNPELVIRYFDLDRDYRSLEEKMLSDVVLSQCVPYASGIRVFNQEPFETLISFIISANNNIKRITRIIESLSLIAGNRVSADCDYFSFPKPEDLAALSVDTLYSIGCGYRAPYIYATTRAILDGFSLNDLRTMDYNTALRALCSLSGVGPKVADCVLLFSLGHGEAFPMDVWMKRAMRILFFNGEEPSKRELRTLIGSWGSEAGIIQQYIFHFARETSLGTQKSDADLSAC